MTLTRRIALVIEDDGDVAELLSLLLQQSGFEVQKTSDGASGLAAARQSDPDVITLDLTLPDFEGLELCRQLREFSDAYVVILTARVDEVDRLIGLETGADDYLTKPFSNREFRARIAAMMRRPRKIHAGVSPVAEQSPAAIYRYNDLEMNAALRTVTQAEVMIDLTKTEFDLLAALLGDPDRVWSREELIGRVWGPQWLASRHLIDVHLANLRRKLGDEAPNQRYIQTVRGVGFRLGPAWSPSGDTPA